MPSQPTGSFFENGTAFQEESIPFRPGGFPNRKSRPRYIPHFVMTITYHGVGGFGMLRPASIWGCSVPSRALSGNSRKFAKN